MAPMLPKPMTGRIHAVFSVFFDEGESSTIVMPAASSTGPAMKPTVETAPAKW